MGISLVCPRRICPGAAAECRAYGYDEHHDQAELHRRYPHLAALHEAGSY
ncbi:hypothetical protein [Streptomyces rubiginosohelvolus]|uniref:Uncharacterized protein n=1 Tax=Streptomyces rubiginosohelvolus TaxID=67362 RepID=A0ABW6EXF7_9ACTN